MPASTEQILHPSAFFGKRDAPTAVTLPPLTSGSPVYQNSLGEFETRLLLFQHLKDQNEAVRGATGWDGDRYILFDTNGGQGIAWVTVWDSPAEASEFFDLIGQGVDRRFGTKTPAISGAVKKQYAAPGRSIEITTDEIGGRPVVLYVDVPAGTNSAVIDLNALKLQQ